MREAAGGGARDTESKTRTPHKDVGNKSHVPNQQPVMFQWQFWGIRYPHVWIQITELAAESAP